MAQQLKPLDVQAGQPEFNPWNIQEAERTHPS